MLFLEIMNDLILTYLLITRQTGYQTEAELFGWSFLLDFQASEDVIEEVDGPMGYGRVK